jgi:hypothetical protein
MAKRKMIINFVDGKLPIKTEKFLVVNHSRKTFHFSDSGWCYREDDGNGYEVTWPNEKYEIFSGKNATKKNVPKGYKDDMRFPVNPITVLNQVTPKK